LVSSKVGKRGEKLLEGTIQGKKDLNRSRLWGSEGGYARNRQGKS